MLALFGIVNSALIESAARALVRISSTCWRGSRVFCFAISLQNGFFLGRKSGKKELEVCVLFLYNKYHHLNEFLTSQRLGAPRVKSTSIEIG